MEAGKLLKSIDGGPGEEGGLMDILLTFSLSLVDVWTLAFSADSRYLATGSHNGKINLFNVEEGKKESALDTRGKFIMSIAYVCQLLSNIQHTIWLYSVPPSL